MEENKKMTDLPFQIEGSLKKLFIGADEIKNKDYDSIEFLVDKLIPQGTLCALVGESDTGKSSLLRQLALSLVYGDDDFDVLSQEKNIHTPKKDESKKVNKNLFQKAVQKDYIVKIKYLNNGLEIEIKLEDSPNIKFKKEGNLNIVNFKSPLGKSLLGCIEGDTVKIGELDTFVEVVSIKN